MTTLHCETSQGKRFPVNSLFLRMRGFLRNGQKARGMGLSGEHVVEHPTVLTIFPVEFPDTGNFRQRRVRSRLAPPPTSRDMCEPISAPAENVAMYRRHGACFPRMDRGNSVSPPSLFTFVVGVSL